MAKVLQHRRGTTAEHGNFTGAAGEITFDTTAKRLVAHDGTTKGGIPVATKQEVEQVATSLDPRILDAASQADILEAVGQVTGGSISQPTLEGLQSQISANASNIVKPVRYVVETWSSGTEWYTKYNDGWKEQGGRTEQVLIGAEKTITFPLPFSSTDYTVMLATQPTDNEREVNRIATVNMTMSTASMVIRNNGWSTSYTGLKCLWRVEGY